MRNRTIWIVRIERQRVATAAVFVHRDRFHSRAARVRCMAFGALDDTLSFRSDNTVAGKMHFVIEFQVRQVVAGRCCKVEVFNHPRRAGIGRRSFQAHPEIRVVVEKIRGVLQRGGRRQVGVTIRAQALVLVDELRWFIVFEVTTRAASVTEYGLL